MKKAIQTLKVIVIAITLLTSCNVLEDKSDKFIGTWERIDEPEHPIVISKSDANFIIQMPQYDAGTGSYRGDMKNPASYIKEQDKLEMSAYGMKFDIIYDTQTNHLLFNSHEYVKKAGN